MSPLKHRSFDFFFQAEDGIRDSVASRGLGDVYKRQMVNNFKIWFGDYQLLFDIKLYNENI